MNAQHLNTQDYEHKPAEETLRELDVDPNSGLPQSESEKRRAQFGFNEIKEKEESVFQRIFRRFWGPIPWMIEAAAVLSAAVQKWDDLLIILVMLCVNAGLDFMQEHRALNALHALKQKLTKKISIKRNGKFTSIPVRELVPGDIIRIRIGEIVPADVKLLDGDYLLIDEAALTGESLPVTKKSGAVAFANTIVKQGEMLAVVVNTGMNTSFSSIVALVAEAQRKESSHFQKMVIQIGNFLILLTILLVVLIIMVSLFRHENFLEIARFSLVLTVAAIPVALPAVLSVTMAVGAINLARRQAIVSRLTAIEELAGVDIFCTDKTGTLTKNEMEVAEPTVFNTFSEQELFLYAVLASKRENNDPIEMPIFNYLERKFPDTDLTSYRQMSFTPFDPIRKRTEADITSNGRSMHVMKGAAQVLLDMSELDESRIRKINDSVNQLASKGYRTLAVGLRESTGPLQIAGLIPLYDPPRNDSQEIIDDMHKFGVKVKMVTGDNLAIAREIGRILGLEQRTIRSSQLSGASANEIMQLVEILTASMYQRLENNVTPRQAREFASDVMDQVRKLYDTRLLEREFIHTHESAIVDMIESVDIFAEVVPEDKFRIVDTLQKGGHIVAMTGDGVNDAPALKKADCGIAVSNATDAARAAADIVLTAPGLSVINEAMKQARLTFSRMKSYATFRIAETIRIILFMTLSIVVFNFYPITALMIILLALLNDIPILAIAYDNTKIHSTPVKWNMQELLIISTSLGIFGVAASFLLFFLLQSAGFSEETIRTFLFLKLIVAGHSTLYVTRSESWFWRKPWPSPLLLVATFGTEILGTVMAVYGIFIAPIGWGYALMVWTYALLWFVVNDVVKVMLRQQVLKHNSIAHDH